MVNNKDILELTDLKECKEELESLKNKVSALKKLLKTTKNPLLRLVKGKELALYLNLVELLERKVVSLESVNA